MRSRDLGGDNSPLEGNSGNLMKLRIREAHLLIRLWIMMLRLWSCLAELSQPRSESRLQDWFSCQELRRLTR